MNGYLSQLREVREWHASLPRPSWHDLLLECLMSVWKGARRTAERPERQVPYY